MVDIVGVYYGGGYLKGGGISNELNVVVFSYEVNRCCRFGMYYHVADEKIICEWIWYG